MFSRGTSLFQSAVSSVNWCFLCSTHSWTEPALQVRSAADWSSRIIPCFFHKIEICIVTPEWHLRSFLFLFYPSTEGHCWFMFSFRSITTSVFCSAEMLLNQLLSLPYLCGWLLISKDLCLSNLINIIWVFFPFFRLHLQFVKIIWTPSLSSNTVTVPPTFKIF